MNSANMNTTVQAVSIVEMAFGLGFSSGVQALPIVSV